MTPEDIDALEKRTRNLLAKARGPYGTGTDVGTLYIFDDANGPCVAEVYDVDENGPLLAASWDLAQQNLALIAETRALREAIRRQAGAVRMSETARKQIDAYERKTLTSLAGQDRAAVLEELAAARDEANRWNAEATRMEDERDAVVTAARNYLDAQHDKFDAETDPRVTKAQFETYRQRYDDTREALEKLVTPGKDTRP